MTKEYIILELRWKNIKKSREEFRLNSIEKIRKCFTKEIDQNELISNKNKNFVNL